MTQALNTYSPAAADKAEIDELTSIHNESTGLSWLWAFMFGPLYFWIHGFVARGFVVFFLNFLIIGFFVAPFLAYPAWEKRARERAERLHTLNKVSVRKP